MIWERSFPFPAVPKVKPTGRSTPISWHVRARRYKPFRDAVRMICGDGEQLQSPLSVRICFLEWNSWGDPDNLVAGVMDALKPYPLPDDSWKHIGSFSVVRSEKSVKGAGFYVTVETAAGLPRADS